MRTTIISNPYQANASKGDGDELHANEWNSLSAAEALAQTKVNGIITDMAESVANAIYTPQMFGAKGDDVTNDTNAFLTLAATVNALPGAKVFLPAGTYLITQPVNFRGNIELYGCGKASVIHLANSKSAITIGDPTKTVLQSTVTGADVTVTLESATGTTCTAVGKGAMTINVSDASEFTPGEWYIIKDTVDYSFDNKRAYYRHGEFIHVKEVDTVANTITLYDALRGNYGTDENFEGYEARQQMYVEGFAQRFVTCMNGYAHRTVFVKPTLNKMMIHDFTIRSTGDNSYNDAGYYALYIEGMINGSIHDMDVSTVSGSHVAMGCYKLINSELRDNTIYADSVGDDAYGCFFGSVQGLLVSNCSCGGRSHDFASGVRSTIEDVVNRDFIYERLQFTPVGEKDKTHTALDSHEFAEHYTYRDINAGSWSCDLGGYDVTVENCTFWHVATAFHRSVLTMRNCEVHENFGSLVWYSNPWHDYTNDVTLIENCKVFGSLTMNGQTYDALYRQRRTIIRNCSVADNITLRFDLAQTIEVTGCSMQYLYLRDRSDEHGSIEYIIRNNVIRSERQTDCGLFFSYGRLDNGKSVGVAYINDNIVDVPNGNNYPILITDVNAFIDGNFFRSSHGRGVVTLNSEATLTHNTIESTNNNPSILIMRDLKMVVTDTNRYVGVGPYTYNFSDNITIRNVHFAGGTTKQRPQRASDNDIYYDTDLKTNVIYRARRWWREDGTFAAVNRGSTLERPNGLAVTSSFRPDAAKATLGMAVKRNEDAEYYKATAISGGIVTWTQESEVAGKTVSPDIPRSGQGWDPVSSLKGSDIYIGFLYFNTSTMQYFQAMEFDDNDNIVWSPLPTDKLTRSLDNGFTFYDTMLKKYIYASEVSWAGDVTWKEEDGAIAGISRRGTFANKPSSASIYAGFKYFCTDKQTTEGQTDGIEITWNGTAWVDALGRTVS